MSVKHNPEFTLLELYQAYTDYYGMMELTENLIATCSMDVNGSTTVEYEGETINLKPPFARLSMTEAILRCAGIGAPVLIAMKLIVAK